MSLNKLYWFMGYNNLGLILEQERKHWLLKTNKKKQLQDKNTGEVFQGQIDNIGSDIVLETEKLPIKQDMMSIISYSNTSANDILNVEYSTFTHSATVNGLMFSRITSTNYPLQSGNEMLFKHYKLKLTNCEKCIIPFGNSLNSPDVFAGKWLKTTIVPKVLLLDNDGNYSIERSLDFVSGITNPIFYYPLDETLQPFDIVDNGSGTYISEAINDDAFIGYPLYWFTCDQSNHGPSITIANNSNTNGNQLMFIGNAGNASKYNAKLYIGIDGLDNRATPDLSKMLNYKIICSPMTGYTFKGSITDYNVPINPTSIELFAFNIGNHYPMGITCNDANDIITMSRIPGWQLVDGKYEIVCSSFDSNCLAISNSALISVFDVHLDESVSFEDTTTDIGYSGIRMGSSNDVSDIYPRYPHDLNKWDGLPEWIDGLEEYTVPQHMSIYAIHNTPSYNPEIPNSRQVAAILLDPGKIKTDDSEELSNDERGRAYLISNDEITYENNSLSEHPKPARTVARICDVPTSVMQLSNISGIAPTSIVDKKYVRSSVAYTIDDKNRLYNVLNDKWVKPTALNANGVSIVSSMSSEDNEFVFNDIKSLSAVDMVNHNDFRKYENLNPVVDPSTVSVASITDNGTGYAINDVGVVVVGGFAFHYVVSETGDEGSALAVTIAPASDTPINLSNFDMLNNSSGFTEAYGTSPLTGSGSGLKFRFMVANYMNIMTYKGEIHEDLYAFVKEHDGLWLYRYIINEASTLIPKIGSWVKTICVSVFEQSSTSQDKGLSTSESYINSIIPSLKNVSVCNYTSNTNPLQLSSITTPYMINIIDKTKTPIANNDDTSLTKIDMCKFYCDGMLSATANFKTTESVIDKLKELGNLRFDSYVFWLWDSMNDSTNKKFKYGIIHRSLNNYVSTDSTTLLPPNELKYKEYVHTNANTMVVWDVENVGVMMWTYNPKYQKYESYNINPETRELYVERKNITWADIDVRDSSNGTRIKLVGASGNLLYNIITNNPVQAGPLDPDMIYPDPIYQQPDFVTFDDLKPGVKNSSILPEHQPMGNWQLTYPRIQSFKFVNATDGREYTPVQLQVIKNRETGSSPAIVDDKGNNVNAKTLLMNETSTGVNVNLYNTETGSWEKI